MNLHKQDPQPSDLEYRTLTLSQGQFAIVDVSDYDWLSQWKWTAWWSPHSKSFYAVRNQHGGPKVERIIMARAIMECPKGKTVDHNDHNTLNNRRYNLRIATYSQNACNKTSVGKSGFKGVQFHPQTGKWRARIQFEFKSRHLGLFATPQEAHQAYQKAALTLHGDFASW